MRRVSVVHAAPGGPSGRHWGDRHYADSLAAALTRAGAEATALPWNRRDDAAGTATIVLRGLRVHLPAPGDPSVLWVISHPDDVTDEELDAFEHVCVASATTAEAFAARTSTPVHVLHQAADLQRFRPPGTRPTAAACGVVVVANHRWPGRRAPRWLRQLDVDFQLYGDNWDGTPEAGYVVAPRVPNEVLAGVYATAEVVVADQWTQMADNGFVANRLFDVAAVGGCLLSDAGTGIPEVFGDLVPTYATRTELGEQLARLADDPGERARLRLGAMSLVRAQHGFEHRATRLLELLAA